MSSAVDNRLWAFLAASLVLHALVVTIASRPPPAADVVAKPIELEVVEIAPPPPPEPVPSPPIVKPPPLRVAMVKPTPPPTQPEAPPPPNVEAETPPEEPPPLIAGFTMESTTTAGSFSAPVGNTNYGAVERTVPAVPAKPYSAPRYQPIGSVDSAPELLSDFKPPYPEEARRAGIEGKVTLKITVDENGIVTSANVLNGIGYGLDEAARDGILKSRFRPAIKGGNPVATMLTYIYRFELP